jgi:hypothetical protein
VKRASKDAQLGRRSSQRRRARTRTGYHGTRTEGGAPRGSSLSATSSVSASSFSPSEFLMPFPCFLIDPNPAHPSRVNAPVNTNPSNCPSNHGQTVGLVSIAARQSTSSFVAANSCANLAFLLRNALALLNVSCEK